MNEIRNAVIRKETFNNENPDKIIGIAEKKLDNKKVKDSKYQLLNKCFRNYQ